MNVQHGKLRRVPVSWSHATIVASALGHLFGTKNDGLVGTRVRSGSKGLVPW